MARLSRLLPWILTPLLLPLAAGAVERVANDAQPRDGVQDVTLREVWRVGSENDDAFFGLVPRVETDDRGRVYILDSQLCEVSVYGRDGKLVDKLFREGEGPGEILRPRDMLVMGDGRVGLVQEFPGAISFVDAAGDPAGRVNYGGADGGVTSLTACQGAGDVILVSGTHQSQDRSRPEVNSRRNFLELIGTDGLSLALFAYNDTEYDFSDFRFTERDHMPPFWWCFAATPTGTIYTVTDRDAYAIWVFDAEGKPQRVIEREYEPLQRTDQQHARLEGMVASAMTGMPFEATIVVERQEAAISSLHRGLQMHPDGSLWVLSGRGLRPEEPGVMAIFDVFDPDGVFVRQVSLRAPHDGLDVGIFLSGPDRVLVVKGYFESLAAQFGTGATFAAEGEEPDTPEVICYEIAK